MPVIENTVVVGRSTMEKAKTRDEILKVALDLFSVNGYEATSISQIADAVGIRKASLYSHFSSKQAILDNVVASVLTGYDNHSVFANTNWDDPEFTKDKNGMTAEDAANMIQSQIQRSWQRSSHHQSLYGSICATGNLPARKKLWNWFINMCCSSSKSTQSRIKKVINYRQ